MCYRYKTNIKICRCVIFTEYQAIQFIVQTLKTVLHKQQWVQSASLLKGTNVQTVYNPVYN
jgi:hypothetical protein